jgi:hypothetical protein
VSWGPADQRPRRRRRVGWFLWGLGALFVLWYVEGDNWSLGPILILGWAVLGVGIEVARKVSRRESSLTRRVSAAGDPLDGVLEQAREHGGGVYLGVDNRGRWRSASAERAVLLLGPPRSGKSSG